MHKAVYNSRMGKHLNSKARAIRLPIELWERLEALSEADGASVNEHVRRRLDRSFLRDSQSHKTPDFAHNLTEGGIFDG